MHLKIDNLPEIIKARRKQLNLTQAQLSAAVGVSTTTIGCFETGRKHPSYTTLISLFECLYIDLMAYPRLISYK